MKHALVTGAGSGIGAAIALAMAKSGHYRVSLIGRRIDALESTAHKIGDESRCQTARCDVTDNAAVSAVFAQTTARFGAIDVLVNCAGAAPAAPFHKLSAEVWQQVLDVNLNGVFHCCSAVVPSMRERGSGRIVNVASTASLKGYALVSAYCAAKHGVLGLTRSLALELANHGITVNAVCPGYSDTDIIHSAVNAIVHKTGCSAAEALKNFTDSNPQGRLIDPREVADTVLYLCSDAARSINGHALSISGGETA